MKVFTKSAIFCWVLASCATTDFNQDDPVEEQPCKLREVERFIRHYHCPSGTYIQRVQTVAASKPADAVLQVTCVRIAIDCAKLKEEKTSL